jgi:hypothetical protein
MKYFVVAVALAFPFAAPSTSVHAAVAVSKMASSNASAKGDVVHGGAANNVAIYGQ